GLTQPFVQGLAPIAANRLRLRACRIELPDDVVENRIQCSICAAAQRGQPRDDALEMSRQALPARLTCPTRPTRLRYSDGSFPFLEPVQHIVFAEFDRHGSPARVL